MDDTMWSALEQERLGLASLLEELTPEQWETPSLCALWRVRDVAAHVAMTPTAPTTSTLLRQLARARGTSGPPARRSPSTTLDGPPTRSWSSCGVTPPRGPCRGSRTRTTS